MVFFTDFGDMMRKIFMLLALAFLLPNVNAKCTPGDGYFLKTTRVIPRNYKEYLKFTKDIKCVPDDLQVHYAVDSWGKETLMGCFCSRPIFGNCLEMNKGKKWIIQPLQYTNCTVFDLSPCNGTYISVFSYLWFQCFDFYGGNLSLVYVTNENDFLRREIEELKNDIAIHQTNNKVYDTDSVNYWAIFCIMFLVSFILSVIVNIYQYKTNRCKSKDKLVSFRKERVQSEDVIETEELNPSNANIVILNPSNTQPEDSAYNDMNEKNNIYHTLNSKESKIFSVDVHENGTCIDAALVDDSVKDIELYQEYQ
ncbi:uncharacterized protein LOC134234516 [Saccostrea cucullata]|uniref:uncharacterized protein LOC134234516 n=1 Tax=Saccostrea cuccullata TaxID=36930 RepID=UPI002ED20E87